MFGVQVLGLRVFGSGVGIRTNRARGGGFQLRHLGGGGVFARLSGD